MDVEEFLSMLLDKLEKAVNGEEGGHILEDNFCGTLVNQVICQGEDHFSEVKEKFFVLSLDVKNKRTITDSLRSYI